MSIAKADDGVINFNESIRPILSNNCYQCHGPDSKERQADLRLDQAEGIESTFAGKSLADSEGWQRILSKDEDIRMPPKSAHKELKPEELDLLKNWILQGAKWNTHWSFVPPKKSPLPKLSDSGNKNWATNPIDAFVLEDLRRIGLSPMQRASKEQLLRRITFDLTGLPPTIKEIDQFLADKSPNAYERVVDRLLDSPRYGERMTLDWMDASRYGDTSVFHADGPRDMWPWRDWVIEAFNSNMPYNQFTIEQLAGDLLPNPTWQQLTASGFARNNGTSDEGGAIDEEYRVEYIVDRIKTVSTVWLGLTMECAQCHDHKYDPISQKDYYKFFAFYNQSVEKGMQTRNGNAAPKIDVPNLLNQPKLELAQSELASIKKKVTDYVKSAKAPFESWQKTAASDLKDFEPLPKDAAFHFTFDDLAKKKTSDSIDAKRKGTLHGKIQHESGKFGKAFRFGPNNFVDLGNVADFERTDSFSYGCWVKYDKGKNGAPLGKMDEGNAHRGFDIHMSGGRPEIHIIHNWPSNAIKVTSKKKFEPNQWHHVFVTYNGTSQEDGIKIYVDGQVTKHDVQHNSLSKSIKTKRPLRIGRRFSASQFSGAVDEVRIYNRELTSTEVAAIAGRDPIKPILATQFDKRTDAQKKQLLEYYLQRVDKQYSGLQKQQTQIEKRVSDLGKPLSSVMVMKDVPKPRMTFILDRGDYASPDKKSPVEPGTPSILPPLPEGAPANRLGMARWLVSDEHPLTARVTVNRFWQMFFGVGLVETVEDFGSQGKSPTNQAILDWLAADFVQSGWDVKRLLKTIAMSSTYRQSSRMTRDRFLADPENLYYSRGPRFRLTGESIRDNALSAAGILVAPIGGAGVKPTQPAGLWNEVSLNTGLRFRPDSGSKLYRRSMYTYWKRSAPQPTLNILGTPSREKCVVRRAKTNTPLQALVTMNDPHFVEAARVMAERMLKVDGDLDAKIELAFRTLCGVRPDSRAKTILKQAYEEELALFKKDKVRAEKLLGIGAYKRDKSLDLFEHAAMTSVCSIIMNLEQCLTRG